MKAIYAALVLATAAPAAVHAEIFLSCQGTQTTFGPTRNDALTENVAGFSLIVDLDKKQAGGQQSSGRRPASLSTRRVTYRFGSVNGAGEVPSARLTPIRSLTP